MLLRRGRRPLSSASRRQPVSRRATGKGTPEANAPGAGGRWGACGSRSACRSCTAWQCKRRWGGWDGILLSCPETSDRPISPRICSGPPARVLPRTGIWLSSSGFSLVVTSAVPRHVFRPARTVRRTSGRARRRALPVRVRLPSCAVRPDVGPALTGEAVAPRSAFRPGCASTKIMEMSGIVEIKTLVTDGCVSGPEHAGRRDRGQRGRGVVSGPPVVRIRP